MNTCRPLSADEAQAMVRHTTHPRDQALLIAFKRTGYRVGELGSLCVGDVFDGRSIKPRIQVKRAHMKRGTERMPIPLHPELRAALVVWLKVLQEQGALQPSTPLWRSRKHGPLCAQSIWRIIKQAAVRAGVDPDRTACHSFRKLFCAKIYADTGKDIEKTRRIMGHQNLSSTQRYLESRLSW